MDTVGDAAERYVASLTWTLSGLDVASLLSAADRIRQWIEAANAVAVAVRTSQPVAIFKTLSNFFRSAFGVDVVNRRGGRTPIGVIGC